MQLSEEAAVSESTVPADDVVLGTVTLTESSPAETVTGDTRQTLEVQLTSQPHTAGRHVLQENTDLKLRLMAKDRRIVQLQGALADVKFGANVIEKSNDSCVFYTGLSTYVFSHLFHFVCNFTESYSAPLTLRDEFLLVLMKLRLNLMNEDLAHRFGVHKTSVSKIFHKWLHVLYCRLKQLIVWPERTVIRKTLPDVFKPKFSKVVCIIDCTEIFIERPLNLLARAQTFSHYKKHNTVKFLIGITPTGCISFLSKAWGGRVSDDQLTRSSGILQKLCPGDVVMADRGFRLQEDFGMLQCELVVPSFTKGKLQLSAKEVELSRAMSRVRIHVERVIGVLKNRYTILQSTLPISLIKRPSDGDVTTIDKIMTVCAALCNLGESVVPLYDD